MTYNKLIKAIAENKDLVWNDPDPIEGNDYTIETVTILNGGMEDDEDMDDMYDDMCALIQYGGGSEATVFISEISLK